MPLRNPFRRQTETVAPSLRERAAELSSRLANTMREPKAPAPAGTTALPVAPAEDTFPPAPTELADACLWAVRHRAWIDRSLKAEDWSEERFDGETAKTNAVFARAINEPSTTLREITAKAALALEDYERFIMSTPGKPDDGARIVHTVLREIVGVGREAGTSGVLSLPSGLAAAILDGWAAWGAVQDITDDDVQAEADARRRDLIHAAMALPATPENITAKALACSWMEWVEAERPGQPRDAYGKADQLVYDLHAAIMARGSQEPAARLTSPAFDFGPDAHIAELAAEFCEAYAANIKADREHVAERMSEAEWLPHYQRATALMTKLEATEPKTLLGMALKCLSPIGAAGYNAPADRDEVQEDPWDRVGTQFQDALVAGTLAPFTATGPHPLNLLSLIDLPSVPMKDLRALYDIANEIGSVAYAMAWTGRCSGPRKQGERSIDDYFNAAGALVQGLGEALTDVEFAAFREARSRTPLTDDDRKIRLELIARNIIQNNDPAEIAAFARELLASVEQ